MWTNNFEKKTFTIFKNTSFLSLIFVTSETKLSKKKHPLYVYYIIYMTGVTKLSWILFTCSRPR